MNCNTHHTVIYCLIPAKPYTESKSRLAPILSPAQRAALSRWLLERTLRLALTAVEHVVVVSRARALLAQARALGAWGLREAVPGLNPALSQAARFAQVRGADGILVLPADLPRLTRQDLDALLALGGVGAGVKPAPTPGVTPAPTPVLVIAPCRSGTGTNALLLRPPGLIPFAFGPDSFAAHCAAARAVGVEPVVHRADSLAFDLDTPEDWELGIRNWGLGLEIG
jgi:2-phospho-L-lactate guanylyltransferase